MPYCNSITLFILIVLVCYIYITFNSNIYYLLIYILLT